MEPNVTLDLDLIGNGSGDMGSGSGEGKGSGDMGSGSGEGSGFGEGSGSESSAEGISDNPSVTSLPSPPMPPTEPPPPSSPPPPAGVVHTFDGIQLGTFKPSEPSYAGTTFLFVARDSDGLPIVSESVNGYPRIESFAAELHWIGRPEWNERALSSPAEVQRLPLSFIGNRQRQADGSFLVIPDPPRSQDGTFQVTINLERAGEHVVKLKGPPADGSSLQPVEYLPWEVRVQGICPIGQLPNEDPPWSCGCEAGTEPISGGAGLVRADCQPCPLGKLKRVNGNIPCETCMAAILDVRGALKFAADRTVTAVDGASSIHDCGCSSGFYLSHNAHSNATIALNVVCPHPTSSAFASQTAPYRPQCCNSTSAADCDTLDEKLCLLNSCKRDQITALYHLREVQPNISGVCNDCSLAPNGLLMEGTQCPGGMHVIEKLNILPGYWRANELSEEVKPCATNGACIGTADGHAGVLDGLCAPNRYGPYCEVCYPSFYKDDTGNCTQCGNALSVFGVDSMRSWLPLAIMMGVVAFGIITFIITKVGGMLRDKPLSPLVWERMDMAPAKGSEIYSRRLKDLMRTKPDQRIVTITKDEWRQVRIRYELRPEHYIKVPLDEASCAYFRPLDTRAVAHKRRVLLKVVPARWRPTVEAKLIAFDQSKVAAALAAGWYFMRAPVALTQRVVSTVLGKFYKTLTNGIGVINKQRHKVKILLSMVQVMDGLHVSFNLTLPISFIELLGNINFISFSLPLDCFFPSNFHVSLTYKTLTPLFLEVVLLAIAMFAGARIPPVPIDERRKPRSKLMMTAMSLEEEALRDVRQRVCSVSDATAETPGVVKKTLRRMSSAMATPPVPRPGRRLSSMMPTPPLRRLSSVMTAPPIRRLSDVSSTPRRASETPCLRSALRSARAGLPPRQVADNTETSSTQPVQEGMISKERARATSYSPPPSPPEGPGKKKVGSHKARIFKELLTEAAISEVIESVKNSRQLHRVNIFLFVAGVLNLPSPTLAGVLAVAAATLVYSTENADIKPERSLKISLAQLQGKRTNLLRVKKKLTFARNFCGLAGVLAILTLSVAGISGGIGVIVPDTVIPLPVSYGLLGYAGLSLLLVSATAATSILADRQIFLLDLKLNDIKLAEERGKDVGETGSRDSKHSGSSRSSRRDTRQSSARAYWTGLQNKCIDTCFAILFLFYPSCSATTFRTFDCESFDDGTRFLRGDYSIDCDSDAHKLMELFSVLMIFVWPIGVPIIYGVSIYLRSGVFETLGRLQVEIRQKRTERQMRQLLAKEEDTFASDYNQDERITPEQEEKRAAIRRAVDKAIMAKREQEAELARQQQEDEARQQTERIALIRMAGTAPEAVPLKPQPIRAPCSPRQQLAASGIRSRFGRGLKDATQSTKTPSPRAGRCRVTPCDHSRPLTALSPGGSQGSIGGLLRRLSTLSPQRKLSSRSPRSTLRADVAGDQYGSSPPPSPPEMATASPGQCQEERQRVLRASFDQSVARMKEKSKQAEQDSKADADREGHTSEEGKLDDGIDTEGMKDAVLEELEEFTPFEEPDFMSEDRIEAMRILSEFHELAGLDIEVHAGSISIVAVWPTAGVSKDLMVGEGDRHNYASYLPSLEERLALTAYIAERRPELEARATRLWLKETRNETWLRSLLLLLKPAGFDFVDNALDKALSGLRENKVLGLTDERLERYIRIVASKDMFRRMDPDARAGWLNAESRISTPKPGDELIAVITADGVRHDVRSKHAKEMSRGLSKSKKKLKAEVIEAFELLDEDKSKMLDPDELNEGLAALGISKSDRQVRKVLAQINSAGNRQYSIYEFDRFVNHIQYARDETESDRAVLKEKALELLRRAGTELVLTDQKSDVVRLELKRGAGETFLVELHKGRAPFPLGRLVPYTSTLPVYVRSLTDAYKVQYRYWEIFECGRKVTLVGFFILFGQGSLEQMLAGMTVCVASIAIYHNLKPYDTWQNNMLQQVCQFNIFATIMSGLVLRAMRSESPGKGFEDQMNFIGMLLSLLTVSSTMLTIPAALLDYLPDPMRIIRLWTRIATRFYKGVLKRLKMACFPHLIEEGPGTRYVGERGDILSTGGEPVYDGTGAPMMIDFAAVAAAAGVTLPKGTTVGKGRVLVDADGKSVLGKDSEPLVLNDKRLAPDRYAPVLDPGLPDREIIDRLKRRDTLAEMWRLRDVSMWRYQRKLRVVVMRAMHKNQRPRVAIARRTRRRAAHTHQSGTPQCALPAGDDESEEEIDPRRVEDVATHASDDTYGTDAADSGTLARRRSWQAICSPALVVARLKRSATAETVGGKAACTDVTEAQAPPDHANQRLRRSWRLIASPAVAISRASKQRSALSVPSMRSSTAESDVLDLEDNGHGVDHNVDNLHPKDHLDEGDGIAAGMQSVLQSSFVSATPQARMNRRVSCNTAMEREGFIEAGEGSDESENEDEDGAEENEEAALHRQLKETTARLAQLERENAIFKAHSRALETQTARDWARGMRSGAAAGPPRRTGGAPARLQLSNVVKMALPPLTVQVMAADEKEGYTMDEDSKSTAAPHSSCIDLSLGGLRGSIKQKRLRPSPAVLNALAAGDLSLGLPTLAPIPVGRRIQAPTLGEQSEELSSTDASAPPPLAEPREARQTRRRAMVERLRMPTSVVGSLSAARNRLGVNSRGARIGPPQAPARRLESEGGCLEGKPTSSKVTPQHSASRSRSATPPPPPPSKPEPQVTGPPPPTPLRTDVVDEALELHQDESCEAIEASHLCSVPFEDRNNLLLYGARSRRARIVLPGDSAQQVDASALVKAAVAAQAVAPSSAMRPPPHAGRAPPPAPTPPPKLSAPRQTVEAPAVRAAPELSPVGKRRSSMFWGRKMTTCEEKPVVLPVGAPANAPDTASAGVPASATASATASGSATASATASASVGRPCVVPVAAPVVAPLVAPADPPRAPPQAVSAPCRRAPRRHREPPPLQPLQEALQAQGVSNVTPSETYQASEVSNSSLPMPPAPPPRSTPSPPGATPRFRRERLRLPSTALVAPTGPTAPEPPPRAN